MKIILGLLFSLASAAPVLAKKNIPDLTEVLRGHGFTLDFGIALMGFTALSLATFSFVKGYELLSRASKKDELEIVKEENDKLVRSVADARQEAEDQKRQIQRITEIFREKVSQEEIFKKNISDLTKEYEKTLHDKHKLLSENEALTLEVNQRSIFEVKPDNAPDPIIEEIIEQVKGFVPKPKKKKPIKVKNEIKAAKIKKPEAKKSKPVKKRGKK